MIKNGQTLKKDGKVCERVRKNLSDYTLKSKENFQWIKGYKTFQFINWFGIALASIFITSVPEKLVTI